MTWPFENDTSAVIHKIASAKLKYGKLQKRLSIFAIALAAMLMSAVLLLISSVAAVNRSGGNSVTGSYHALISGVRQEEFERLQAEQESVLTGLTVSMGSIKTGNGRLNLSYSNADALTLNGLTVSDGRMPETEHEILIEKDYLDYLELDAGIGDSISIAMPGTQDETVFSICGYLETAASGTGRSLYAGIVSEQYFLAQGGWDAFSPSAMIRVNTAASKAEIEKLAAEMLDHAGIRKIPSFNEAYINLSKPSLFLIGTAAAGLAVIIAACILVVCCIFYIATVNSIKEYGQLRTIGMTGRQIKRMVFREGFTLSATAIPIGLAAGTLFSCLLIPQGFRPASLLWVWPMVIVLIYLTVWFSLRKPARLAASVSPIDASRYMGQQSGKKRQARLPEKITPVMLAKKHISTNRKTNVLTVLSLVLTGVLLMGLSSVLSSINARDMSLSGFPRGQFIINISDERLRNDPLEQVQASAPFTASLKNSLRTVSGLEAMTEYHYLPAAFAPEAVESEISIVGFNRDDIDLIRACRNSPADLEYNALVEQNLLIVGCPDSLERDYGIRAEAGQRLTLTIFDGSDSYQRSFTVGTVLDQRKIGGNGDKIDMLMLPVDVMNDLVSCDTMYQLALRVSDDREAQAEAEIDQILKEAAGLSVTSLSAAIAQNENFIQGMKLVLTVVVAFIGCFAMMNLVNTILTSVITRRKEFALMCCVGMSQKQLSSMVRCESLITSGIGLFFSVLIGGGVGAALCSHLKSGLMVYLHYRFPTEIALAYSTLVILSALTVAWAALKHQNKLSLIEQLRV
jgi:ABC-type antimicrobial peptide transport system permease subunit